jgi:hypothetical protein
MAVNVSVAQLTGNFKEAYGSDIRTLYPDVARLQKEIGELSPTERVGNKFHQPVILTKEQGFTYGGQSGDAYALNTPVAMSSADAQLEGSEGTLASRIAVRTAAKAVASAKAFKQSIGLVIKSNLASHGLRKELEMWYGRSPTGICATSAGTADSGTQETLTITAATWAPGIWSGQEGASLDFYRVDTGARIGAASGLFTLTAIDTDNKKITVTGASGDCTTLHAQAAQLYCDFAGARGATFTAYTASEGIDYALTLAAGNTLWNVSTTNSLWRGTQHDCAAGALTLGKVLAGSTKAIGKAGLDEAVSLFVSADTWPSLADSFSASRQLDQSYNQSEGKNGVEKITYVGANGIITVVPHPCVKGGEAFMLPIKSGIVKKVGSTDITLNNPGRGDEIFLVLPSNNGFEFRSYSDFCVFVAEPAKCVKFKGIVNP